MILIQALSVACRFVSKRARVRISLSILYNAGKQHSFE
jgi:hypothetical protein